MKRHATGLVTLILLSACGPGPQQIQPSPSASPTAEPTAAPSPSPSTFLAYTLKGSFEDLQPNYTASPTITITSLKSQKTYSARILNYARTFSSCSNTGNLFYPAPGILSNGQAAPAVSFEVQGIPVDEDLRLTVSYPNLTQLSYELKAGELKSQPELRLSQRHGLRLATAAKVTHTELYYKIEINERQPLPGKLKFRSLDAAHPFEAEITSTNGSGALLGVPAGLPLEITTETPNHMPFVTRITTPASSSDEKLNSKSNPAFAVVPATPEGNAPPQMSHLRLRPNQAAPVLQKQDFFPSVNEGIPMSPVHIRSLDPSIPFDQTLLLQDVMFITPSVRVDLPQGVHYAVSAQFRQSTGLYNGIFESETVYFTDGSERPSLQITANGVTDTSPEIALVSPTSAIYCPDDTLSVIERTTTYGMVTRQGQPLAGVTLSFETQNTDPEVNYRSRIITGTDGRFHFSNIHAGVAYKFKATYNGQVKTQDIVLKSNKEGNPDVNRFNFSFD